MLMKDNHGKNETVASCDLYVTETAVTTAHCIFWVQHCVYISGQPDVSFFGVENDAINNYMHFT